MSKYHDPNIQGALDVIAQPPQVASRQDTEHESRLVSALARGVGVLGCFSPSLQELSGKALMEMTGLPKPTLTRMLDTLCELGLLHYSERLSKYVPGLGLLNLAAPALARMTVRQLARPLMEELAEHIGGQVQLLAGIGDNLTYVEVVHGSGSPIVRPEIGTHLSLSRTASGRAFVLQMPEPEHAAWLADFTRRKPGQREWLAGRLADAARDLETHGFCRGHSDLHREIETIAVPMSRRRDGEALVFGAAVPVFSVQSKRLVEDLGPRLLTLARNVEASLGT